MTLLSLTKLITKKLEREAKRTTKVQEVAEAVLSHLVENTPVDTSKALSNWQVSVNSPITNTTTAYVQGSEGDSKDASVSRGLAEGMQIIKSRLDGEDIYITNNLDYIKDLEEGKSPQGGHFVKKALTIGRAVAELG